MTRISKGESLPDPGQEWRIEGVGKDPDPGSGAGPGPGSDAGWGWDTGSVADGASAGAGDPAPRRIDPAAGGRWAELIAPSPVPSARVAAAAGTLGGQFDDIVYVGRGGAKFTMEEKVPPGYVLVEFGWTGPGYLILDSIDWNGREAVGFGGTLPAGRFAQRVMWCDNLYPLRFRLRCGDHDEWAIVIRSVAGVRELGEGATGRGSEVLLHTGPAGELRSRLRPAKADASLDVKGHKPRRPDTPATYPDTLASLFGRRLEDSRKLAEGPLLVEVLKAEGEWSLDIGPVRPPEEKKSGFWARLLGR
ncbi:hypothetical protein ABZ621_19940 [Streptomyces sp. NPDC007863]|uniref:hypothetical protein n=1 Tax=Streptomyces sp. NPDC007863 TaxID=3154894 RepID=UPI0033F562C7